MTKRLSYMTQTPEETMALGKALGTLLQGGELLALEGDLGAGKTHFIKGLALGMGVAETVTSPTFNLIHEYSGRLPLAHFDVYRLDSPAELENLGYEAYFYGSGVTAVEWSDQIQAYLPVDYLKIRFTAAGPQQRLIQFIPMGEGFGSLLEALQEACGLQPHTLEEDESIDKGACS